MTKKKSSQKLISKVAPKKMLDKNAEALKSYDYYKKTSDLIERTDVALGRKPTFKTDTGSTLNLKSTIMESPQPQRKKFKTTQDWIKRKKNQQKKTLKNL